MENITYQMTQMSYNEQSIKLAGPIALLKYQATRVSTLISDHAVQIFGGRGMPSIDWVMNMVAMHDMDMRCHRMWWLVLLLML